MPKRPPTRPPAPEVDPETNFGWPTLGPAAEPFIPGLLDPSSAAPQPEPAPEAAAPEPELVEAEPSFEAEAEPAPKRSAGPTLQALAERQARLALEVERQGAATDATLRQLSTAIKDLSTTVSRLVGTLPGLVKDAGAEDSVAQRFDQLEFQIHARLDQLAALAAGVTGPDGAAERVAAAVREEMDSVGRQLEELGERLRAEVFTSAAQTEARLAQDRDHLTALVERTVQQQRQAATEAVTRDHLRQFWVEMAAKLSKLQELASSEQARLRHDIDDRLEQVRTLVASQTSSSTAVTRQLVSSLTERTAGAFDTLRREVQDLAAQMSVTLEKGADRFTEEQERSTMLLGQQLSRIIDVLTEQPWRADIDQLRAELTTAAAGADRRQRADRKEWEQQLKSTLETLGTVFEHTAQERDSLVTDLLGVLSKPRRPLPPSPGISEQGSETT
jgi:hypothetical protein